MTATQIAVTIAVVLILGVIIFPIVNRRSFRKLPFDQQVRILMKEANSLQYFKNVSNGSNGSLYYVKNKRKILILPWKLDDGKMVCTRKNPFANWDYPEEKDCLSEDELSQLIEQLEKFNKKNPVKIVFK